jgi:hypothetical protein
MACVGRRNSKPWQITFVHVEDEGARDDLVVWTIRPLDLLGLEASLIHT